jgi:hypothetical protein
VRVQVGRPVLFCSALLLLLSSISCLTLAYPHSSIDFIIHWIGLDFHRSTPIQRRLFCAAMATHKVSEQSHAQMHCTPGEGCHSHPCCMWMDADVQPPAAESKEQTRSSASTPAAAAQSTPPAAAAAAAAAGVMASSQPSSLESPLESSWCFYFDKKLARESVQAQSAASFQHFQQNLQKCGQFDTVQGFWQHYSYMQAPDAVPKDFNYYLFRGSAVPAWESFPQGGCWILKVRKHNGVSTRVTTLILLLLLCLTFLPYAVTTHLDDFVELPTPTR